MKTDNLAMMQPDARLYGKNITKKHKFLLFLLLSVPSVLVYSTIWRLNDAMICGLSLCLFYFGICGIHYWKVDASQWKHVIRKDFSGNSWAKFIYHFWFVLLLSLIFSGLMILYCAYVTWGPQAFTLPMPYVRAKVDLVYYFWTIILYLLVIPIGEVMFFFIMQQLSWTKTQGQLLVPIAYGAMNYTWIVPCVNTDWWRAIVVIFFTIMGFVFYWTTLRRDIFRTFGLRFCLSGSFILLLIWLCLLKEPASPNKFYKGSSTNYFYETKVLSVQELNLKSRLLNTPGDL